MIVLNGGSSSGKSGIARCLQAILPDPWLTFGTDNLIQAMPMSLQTSAAGIEFAQDGGVIVGPEFRTLEAAWIAGIAAMAQAGARIIVDEVFVGGAASQLRGRTRSARCRCCGSPSGVTPPWPRAASSPEATGSSEWPRPRPN